MFNRPSALSTSLQTWFCTLVFQKNFFAANYDYYNYNVIKYDMIIMIKLLPGVDVPVCPPPRSGAGESVCVS